MDDYYEGKGCQCYAAYQGECCCEDVDWTPEEVYKLRELLEKAEKEIKQLNKILESL